MDNPLACWCCGQRGVPGSGTVMLCLTCDVTWWPRPGTVPARRDVVSWEGLTVRVVDFTRPGAPPSPA